MVRGRSALRRIGRPSVEDLVVLAQEAAQAIRRPFVDHEVDTHWASRGRCASVSPDDLFVKGPAQQREASEVCYGCPVRLECLADALDSRNDFGVWGGLTERERRALRRRRPDVTSWREALVASCSEDLAEAH